MERRVTLRDIAWRTGYHYSTISPVLNDDLTLPVATREKTHRTAAS
ncbi:LacI family DNA-binding transcriptional regulator [Opitutaceae bacterium TAV4]|nr:LacI family DNA-binding transcriptional regulator [Geminisphaera colitermitum]RRJ95196.1 LacI family DNA-binding transcriptional regulator [Opitutaceae bacterium TAV4]RRJ99453.1 LacI family DNA-binding transcriptional regulator [Opitutaceae bacterium TAV3]